MRAITVLSRHLLRFGRGSMPEVRFEEHHTETRGPNPPQSFTPMLRDGERVVSVETVKDLYGYAAARVWIERG